MLGRVLAGFGSPRRFLRILSVHSFIGLSFKSSERRHTQIRLEASHAPHKSLAHLAQVHSIEEKVIWIGGDINFVDATICPTKKKSLRTERVCRANWKVL
jgi:hypothetical protein